jgi:hypothetical protein
MEYVDTWVEEGAVSGLPSKAMKGPRSAAKVREGDERAVYVPPP